MAKIMTAFFRGILIVLVSAVATWGSEKGSGSFMPSWEPGLTWTLRLETATWKSGEGNGGGAPGILLKYRVRGLEEAGGETCWAVEVSGEGAAASLTATLFYRAADFSLSLAEVTRDRMGRTDGETWTFPKESPAYAKFADLPLDTPVFPLVAPSTRTFEMERRIGDGLAVRETVVQTVAAVKGNGRVPACEVSCRNKEGKVLFVQRWERGRPWAVEGRSGDRKYRMEEP
jgi:hypothetical protein